MAKGKHPPFKMEVRDGRLIPATAYDQERLLTYRNGTRLTVAITPEKSRVGMRKWWAILNRAVKECPTPWKTADQASEAIKLALGIVNLSKTVGGKFMSYPKSLTDLTDPELDDAVRDMIDVIYQITGVDPAEWRKQTDGIDEADRLETAGEPATGEAEFGGLQASPAPGQDDAGPATEPPQEPQGAPAATERQAEPENAPAAPPAGKARAAPIDPEAEARVTVMNDEDRAWLKLATKMLWAATAPNELDVLRNQFDGIRKFHTPSSVGMLARDKGMGVYKRCKKVAEGAASAALMWSEIEAMTGLRKEDLA
jgi:hypothetical protein